MARTTRARTRKTTTQRRTRTKSHSTRDHDEIRQWAERRGGHPAMVKGTGRGKKEAGVLRIDYPGYRGEKSLQPISWDEFFDKFDQNGLAIILQEKTATGKTSRFSKLVRGGPGKKRAA